MIFGCLPHAQLRATSLVCSKFCFIADEMWWKRAWVPLHTIARLIRSEVRTPFFVVTTVSDLSRRMLHWPVALLLTPRDWVSRKMVWGLLMQSRRRRSWENCHGPV